MSPADSIEVQMNEGLQRILREYGDFRLCREIGCFPEALHEQPADRIMQWKIMLSAEAEAERKMIERSRHGGG